MKSLKLGATFTIFLLFFGIAALEAIRTHNWPSVAFWLATSAVFFVANR
jgi:hypothetical protein